MRIKVEEILKMMETYPYSLPSEIKKQPQILKETLRVEYLDSISIVAKHLKDIGQDLMIGSGAGDSLFACMCAVYYFCRWGKQLIHAVDVLEFSRYFYRTLTARSIAIVISYSGETIRSLEACYATRSKDSHLVVMTRDLESSMARLANDLILNTAGIENSNCRTGSFLSMHLGLLLLALEMNEKESHKSDAKEVIEWLSSSVGPLNEYIHRMEYEMRLISKALDNTRRYYFLGAGIGWPIARYGVSKLYETASYPSIAEELEQFAHCEIFSTDPEDTIVILGQNGPSYSRAVEVADSMRKIGSTVWGLSDNPAFAKHCSHFTSWPASPYEELSTIFSVVPLQWFAYYRGIESGDNPDRVRHKDINSPLIRQCSYWSEEEYQERFM